MINGIKGVIAAVRDGLIRHVNCVLSVLRYLRNPFGNTFFSFLDSFYGTESPLFERVFKVCVLRTKMRKTFSVALHPCLVCGIFHICGACIKATVIVYNDFGRLAVTFARNQHIGSGIFQHRDEIG